MDSRKKDDVLRRISDLNMRADMNGETTDRTIILGEKEAEDFLGMLAYPVGMHVMGCALRVDRDLHGIILEVLPPPPKPRRYV